MGAFLPSEVARLVLGYLEEQGCMRAYDEFLNGCRHLEECRGRGFFTRIMGLSLLDILDEYCAIHSHILQVNCDEDFKKKVLRCQSLLEKVKLFVDDNGNDGNPKIKAEKLSQSARSIRGTPAKSRHVRSNSCDSVITIKTEKSYSRVHRAASNERSHVETERRGNQGRCHIHHITRSNESLAEATNSADLPGNKRFSRCNCEPVGVSTAPRGRRNLPSTSASHRNSLPNSKPSCSNTHHNTTQTYKENLNKALDRNKFKPMDQEELEFRKALGLVKLPDVPEKHGNKTPTNKIVSKLKDCSTIKKANMTDCFPSDSFNVTTITNALLDCTELHEKLAENINKMYNSNTSKMADDSTIVNITQYERDQSLVRDVNKDPNNQVITIEDDMPQFDTVIKSIVEKTEEDPIFDQLLNEVLAATVESSSDSDVLSRPGTSTPEKSCRSQLNESSPAPSWTSDKNKSSLEDKLARQRVQQLKAQPKSINMLNVSPHKSFSRNRRFPRGGKRMDVLRENYRSVEYETKDDNSSITSSKSNSPTIEVHRDPILKSNQNIIILSNEVIQTHLMSNNGPLVVQKSQECSLPQTNQTDKSVEVLQPQADKTVGREAQSIGSIPPGQESHPGASQSTSLHSTASAESLGSQQPASPSLANQPPTRPQRDARSHSKTNVIPADQGQTGKNNLDSTHNQVPFVPGMVRYLSYLPSAAKPPAPLTEMLPPVSSTKTYSEVTFSSSTSQPSDAGMVRNCGTSLRNFRRNIVTGKPPDIVISNSKGTSSCAQNNTFIPNCYSEEEIMKMPTIIVLPDGHPENKSDCENRGPDSICMETKMPSGNMAQLLPKILPATILHPNQSEKNQKSTPGVTDIQPCNIKWAANAPPNITPTPAEVSSLLPMDISKTEKINVCFGSHLSSKPKTCSMNSSKPVNLSACETNLLSNYVQGTFMPRDISSVQSNASSEDDRFIIDEGHKSNEIEAIPIFKKEVLTESSSQETNILTTNVVGSQETKLLDQLESKRANTPDLIIGKRTSASTPRRSFTHVRVLDFNTPPRNSDVGSRKTQSSPKQSLRTHGTTKKAHNLRPKAHNVKSQLFPTIAELPAQRKVPQVKVKRPRTKSKECNQCTPVLPEPVKSTQCKVMKPKRSRTKSKENTVLPLPVTSTQCKVMKPRRSHTKSKEVSATEESVSKVWDDVQGMGQILKDDSSGVKKSKISKPKLKKKDSTSESSGSDFEEDKVVEDPDSEKKRLAEEAAAEWARIRNIDKKCWDQEMRSVVSISFNHPKAVKPKSSKKRRKITKSTIPTSKVVTETVKDELSKSTEDEGKLLENALNKTQDSEYAETPLKDTSATVIIPLENTSVLLPTKSEGETNIIDVGNEEENSGVSDSKNLNTIIFEGGSLPVMEDTSNLQESDNMSNTDFLLHIKLLRESMAKNGTIVETDKNGKKPKPYTITRPTSPKKSKPTIKVKMNCKNSSEDRSKKEPNIEAVNKKGKSKQKGKDSSKDIQTEHLVIKTEGEHPATEATTTVEVHQAIDEKSKLGKNLEPPIPQVKITPDMPRELDPYSINAKYNLASLLETPLKCGILDLHLETPKFKISPGFFNEIGLSSALKLLDMPTPNFPTPLLAGLTPRTTAKDCTPGSYSSRPTDYSGSSSYYKPDEIEFDPEHAAPVLKTATMEKTIANQQKSTANQQESEKVEKEESSETIPQRVLRPRSTPKVYYPPQIISATPRNKSLSRNTSSDKPVTSEVKSKKKTPAKVDISLEMYISSDSSTDCSTCSSSDDEQIIKIPPTEIKTETYSTSTPVSRTDKVKENSRVQLKNSPSKVLKTLQQLEEKRKRVMGKLNSFKGESSKKETKTHLPKKLVLNSQLSLKKTPKPIVTKTNVVKIPSPVVEQKPTTTQPTASADKSPEKLINLLTCPSKVLAIKSRRKSTTPRKLSTDKESSSTSNSMMAEVQIVKGIISTEARNTIVKGAKKTDDSKEKILNIQDHMEDIIKEKEASVVDKSSSEATCSKIYPTSGDPLDLKLHGLNVTGDHAAGDKIILAENPTTLKVPSILIHSPKSSEGDSDLMTLHLSSDEADAESIHAKSQSEPGDITQIRNFITISSSDSDKTPFRKNLEKEGFDEISAKKIEKDLTDSVEFDEVFTGNCSSKLVISTNQCHKNDDNVPNTNSKASTQDGKDVHKANSSLELYQKSALKISTYKNLEEKGKGKYLEQKEIPDATANKDNKCSEVFSCDTSRDLKIDNEAEKQENNVLHALEICKKDNSQCSVPSVPKESTECAASEIKPDNYTNKLSFSNATIIDESEISTKSSSTSKNHYKPKEQSHINKNLSKIRNSGIEKNKCKSTIKTSPKSKIRDSANNLIMSSKAYGKSKDSGVQRGNKISSTNIECSAQLLPKATNEMNYNEDKSLPQSAKSTSTPMKPTLPLENPATNCAENPDVDDSQTVVWERYNCNSTSKNFLQIDAQKKKIKKLTTNDSRRIDTYSVSAEIYNSAIGTEQLRVFKIGEFKEVLSMQPDLVTRKRVLRREAVALRKQKLLNSKGSVKRRPLDLLIEEMSKSTHNSPTSSNQNISENEENIKDGDHDVSFETETANAINSILLEAENNVFVYTPVKFLHCVENVEAACETLTKAIIEDDFVEQFNEDKSPEQAMESPQKSDDEELQNIIRTEQSPTNIIFGESSKKNKEESEKVDEAIAMRIYEYTETHQMRKSEDFEESEEPFDNLNPQSETGKKDCSGIFNEPHEKICTNFGKSKQPINNKEFEVKSGELSENRTTDFDEKADELRETSYEITEKSCESSEKINPIIVKGKVDKSGEPSVSMNTKVKGNEWMEKINEKRKRQDSANEPDDGNAKKIKIDTKQLFKQLDIESILEKLHGHS